MASCHLREHGSEVGRAERQRRGNPQAATKFAGGQDRLLRHVDLGADPGRIVPERRPGFGESSSARGSCKELDAKLRLEPGKPPADDRLGDAEPARGRRNAARVGDFHECPQFFDIQFGVPHSATRRPAKRRYRIGYGNGNVDWDGATAGA